MSTPPFLPGQRKTAFRSKPRNVILLWLVLIILFVGIYQLFTGPPAHVPRAQPLAASDDGFGNYIAVAMGALFFFMVALVFRQQHLVRRAIVMNGEAVALLGRGELQKARALFEEMVQKFSRLRTMRALAQHNLAAVLVREGQLDRAIQELVALHQGNALSAVPSLQALSAADLALDHALAGQLDLAKPWLDEAERKRPTAGDPLRLIGAMALVRAIVACRQGAPAEATRLLDGDWHTLEGLAGDQLRPLRLMRAFALSLAGGPRDDGAVDRLLAPLREGRPDSLRYLAAAWPELAQFLDGHHL